jgi:hypothetical protein
MALFVETECPWPLIGVAKDDPLHSGNRAVKFSEYIAS